MVGRLISLAVVLGCSTAVADDGRLGMPLDSQVAASLAGDFSGSDSRQLEYASAAAATTVRVAAMQRSIAYSAPSRKWRTASAEAVSSASDDVFQHSSQLLPWLVTRPQSRQPVLLPTVARRPGLVQPVGVSDSSIL